MKYKPVSELCKCGKKRRNGQRDCAECHTAAMKESRRKKRTLDASSLLDRAQLHLLDRITPKMQRKDWKGVMDARALLIGKRLSLFSDGGGK